MISLRVTVTAAIILAALVLVMGGLLFIRSDAEPARLLVEPSAAAPAAPGNG